jgi:glycerophosphoryl diester phosphodiesterase
VILWLFAGLLAHSQVSASLKTEKTPSVELMKAAQSHARAHHDVNVPTYSPNDRLIVDSADVRAIKDAGFPTIPWTVNSPQRMQELFDAGVDGIISDRPDLLRELVLKNKDARGGLLDENGVLRRDRFDAQAHRGGRDLRPESTLPAFENGLDNLVTTLETDVAVSKDGIGVLSHEPYVNPQTCRSANGKALDDSPQILFKDITIADLHARFVCDKVFRGDQQKNDLALSPVSVAFVKKNGITSAYVHPTVQMLFDFLAFYSEYYTKGAGSAHADAWRRALNSERVRFNLETKIDPRFPDRTVGPEKFVEVLAGVIEKNAMHDRADIQSFDFRTLKIVQEKHPNIRTVYLVENSAQMQFGLAVLNQASH